MPFLACLLIVIVMVILFGFISALHDHFPEEVEGVGILILLALLILGAAWALYGLTNIP